jgi:hypothetical protein
MGTDAYEREYMDGGDIVYREKHVARIFTGIFLVMALAIAAVGAFITIAALAQGAGSGAVAGIVPLLTAGLLSFVGLYFAVMRTVVSRTHLSVTWGTLGSKIALAAITDARFEERIGLGPKFDGRGWLYGPMTTSRGVRLEWSEGGKTRTCYVGATDPEALMRAIQDGRGAGHARIDVSAAADAGARAEAEAEAEAAGAEGERRARS